MKVETNLLPSSRPTRLSLTQMQCFNNNFSTTLFSWWRKGMERIFDWNTHRNFVSCCALLRRSGIDKSITNECFPHGTFLSPWNMMNHFNDVYQDCTNTDTIITSYEWRILQLRKSRMLELHTHCVSPQYLIMSWLLRYDYPIILWWFEEESFDYSNVQLALSRVACSQTWHV